MADVTAGVAAVGIRVLYFAGGIKCFTTTTTIAVAIFVVAKQSIVSAAARK